MISVNNVTKEFGGVPLFRDVTFNINPKDRIGLAGKNGSGKTTLLKIITGVMLPDEGKVVVPEGVTMGYLPQEKDLKSNLLVVDEMMQAFSFLDEWKSKIRSLEDEIAGREDYETKEYAALIEKYNLLSEQLHMYQPEKLKGEAEKILTGLGFKKEELTKKVNTFSIGWQMRIELGKLLLLKPDLLLLDEPTNHLDIESIQWLELFLKSYHGSVMMVSHDRAFLDNITNRTIEINNGKAYDYKVPYSQYVRLRNERLEHQKAAYTNQQKEIKEIEDFIEKFRYKATKAKQVQSRIKQLEKMDRVTVEELDNKSIRFRFPEPPHCGKVTLEAKNITKRYGEKLVLDQVDFHLLRGEKVAFVGRNGEGKTTLTKVLLGLTDYEGEVKRGYQVKVAYYAQDQLEMLNPENTVFQEVDQVAVGEVRTRLKTILGSFLFRGDDIDKKVKVLSGGEKSRLALAKLLLEPVNLLVLDEPTNHLDILSKDILKSALLEYQGSVIIVSHDRDFLQGLTTKVYAFKDHKIKEYQGDVTEYLQKFRLETLKQLEQNESVKNEKIASVSENKLKYEQKKELERKIRKLTKQIETCEQEIEHLENEMTLINEQLSNPEKYKEEIQSGTLYKHHREIEKQLTDTMEQWERLSLEVETLKQQKD